MDVIWQQRDFVLNTDKRSNLDLHWPGVSSEHRPDDMNPYTVGKGRHRKPFMFKGAGSSLALRGCFLQAAPMVLPVNTTGQSEMDCSVKPSAPAVKLIRKHSALQSEARSPDVSE
ncbi:hypothetical protein KUCAC02_028080 [Chaenocephalus aceratus]|uniref:Uncharacterized protein n=1 Tax=Chaenocephalus aceratus TaxID=36190 RepID=A0ACB9X1Y3_CHAAC|nr:hypothetical protein KUCAC02_028080 [Chaenocephalus aceratus]